MCNMGYLVNNNQFICKNQAAVCTCVHVLTKKRYNDIRKV